MVHAKGVGKYWTRCKAWGSLQWVREEDGQFNGTITENWGSVDCPKCLEAMPKSVKRRLAIQREP